ncbi:4-hydroxy-3-methylbut-2-en-1-yl diphosphate synthase, partial [Streptomyces hirsutus]
GEVIKTVPESKIVETLIEEAMKIAEQMEADGAGSGAPTGTGKPAVTVG